MTRAVKRGNTRGRSHGKDSQYLGGGNGVGDTLSKGKGRRIMFVLNRDKARSGTREATASTLGSELCSTDCMEESNRIGALHVGKRKSKIFRVNRITIQERPADIGRRLEGCSKE